MCMLCEMGFGPTSLVNNQQSTYDPIAANGTTNVLNTGDQNIDATLIGTRWDSTSLTYTFPTSSSYFLDNPYEIAPGSFDQGYVDSFLAFTSGMQTASRAILDQFDAVSGLTLTEITPSTTNQADIVFGQTNDTSLSLASGRFPGYGPNEGHLWFRDEFFDDVPVRGTYTWITILHEIGHGMGLAHGNSADSISSNFTGRILTADRDSMEFSVMTNKSYIGSSVSAYTNAQYDFASTLMMYDIAALQALYGADYTTNSGSNTYTWSATTGEMFIDGVGQGASGANRTFLTIWDGGGEDTFDLRNYRGVEVNLAPGGWSTFAHDQLADLGDGFNARGNVFNSLLFEDNAASLIENVLGTIRDDFIAGNQAENGFVGYSGADTLVGGGGDDSLNGGSGADLIYGDEMQRDSGVGLFGDGSANYVGNWYNSRFGARDLTNSFHTTTDPNVEGSDTNPHVTVRFTDSRNNSPAASPQWYRVDLNEGSTVIVDIDATSSLDSFISIYDDNGNRIGYNDDDGSDTGSSTNLDSRFVGTVPETGTYYVEVGRFQSSTSSQNLLSASEFDLHITVIPPEDLGAAGPAGADDIFGGDGDDTLFGGAGNDWLRGGRDDDTLEGGQDDDWLDGGQGRDRLYGGDGVDWALYQSSTAGVNASLAVPGSNTGDAAGDFYSSIEGLAGSSYDDILNGNGQDNTLQGNAGNDSLFGGNGMDLLNGGADADFLAGGGFSDTLEGDTGNDTLEGGTGGDLLYGQEDADTLIGGSEVDTLYGGTEADILFGGSHGDFLFGGAHDDTLQGANGEDEMFGDDGADDLYGGNGVDYLFGGNNDDRIFGGDFGDIMDGNAHDDYLEGGRGADVIAGNSGSDTLYGQNDADTLYGGDGFDILDSGDSNDTVFGGDASDSANGRTGSDYIYGGNGVDTLLGENGDDELYGDADQDYLFGGANNDQLFGGTHADLMWGGLNDDSLFGGTGEDTLRGESGDDTLYGESGFDILFGGTGFDTLYGGSHDDTLNGGQFIDTLYGDTGQDTLIGETGSDFLFGGNDDDTLFGGSGADRLDGGSGDDRLVGGANGDTFVFSGLGNEGHDTIAGFTKGSDIIEIGGSIEFSSLTISSTGSGTLISWGDSEIELLGVGAGTIAPEHFFFV